MPTGVIVETLARRSGLFLRLDAQRALPIHLLKEIGYRTTPERLIALAQGRTSAELRPDLSRPITMEYLAAANNGDPHPPRSATRKTACGSP
ncbi:MAG TPA: hypothetical protein VH041_06765 [Caldimonas sp.]|nr:hypothetical protein [Caldimonas sp.]HEX4233991.1 hypothetical protein [Caldimonas sp.]